MAEDNVIIPTLGRSVWFKVSEDKLLTAMVVHVQSAELVNLAVFSQEGKPTGKEGIPMFQGDHDKCPVGSACWMPYQKGKAQEQNAVGSKQGVKSKEHTVERFNDGELVLRECVVENYKG